MEEKNKSWITTFLLCLFLGPLGIHRFYTNKIKSGILQLITLGGLFIWSVIDLITIASQKFKDNKGNRITCNDKKNKTVVICISFIVVIIEVIYLINILKGYSVIKDKYAKIQDYNAENYAIQIFMEYDATETEINKLRDKLNQLEGINSIQLKTKEDAAQEMKQKIQNSSYNIDSDIFAVSYIVTVNDPKLIKKISSTIEQYEEVRNVSSDFEFKQRVDNVNNSLEIFKICFCFFVTIVIIYIISVLLSSFIIVKQIKTYKNTNG